MVPSALLQKIVQCSPIMGQLWFSMATHRQHVKSPTHSLYLITISTKYCLSLLCTKSPWQQSSLFGTSLQLSSDFTLCYSRVYDFKYALVNLREALLATLNTHEIEREFTTTTTLLPAQEPAGSAYYSSSPCITIALATSPKDWNTNTLYVTFSFYNNKSDPSLDIPWFKRTTQQGSMHDIDIKPRHPSSISHDDCLFNCCTTLSRRQPLSRYPAGRFPDSQMGFLHDRAMHAPLQHRFNGSLFVLLEMVHSALYINPTPTWHPPWTSPLVLLDTLWSEREIMGTVNSIPRHSSSTNSDCSTIFNSFLDIDFQFYYSHSKSAVMSMRTLWYPTTTQRQQPATCHAASGGPISTTSSSVSLPDKTRYYSRDQSNTRGLALATLLLPMCSALLSVEFIDLEVCPWSTVDTQLQL